MFFAVKTFFPSDYFFLVVIWTQIAESYTLLDNKLNEQHIL